MLGLCVGPDVLGLMCWIPLGLPLFLNTVSNQKLDFGKAWE